MSGEKDAIVKALEAAVRAIYFNDNNDYLWTLWDVVRALNPDAARLLENDEEEAYRQFGGYEEEGDDES